MNKNRFIIVAVLTLVCAVTAGSVLAQAKLKSEDEVGLRQETTVYDETKAMPAHGEYGKAEAGKSKPLGRAFENSPPLIRGDEQCLPELPHAGGGRGHRRHAHAQVPLF
jgi:hypothetical protein